MTPLHETRAMKRLLPLAVACLLAAACDGDATGPDDSAGVPQRYTVVPIQIPAGTAPGPSTFIPAAINGSGQVVLTPFFTAHMFVLWSGGSLATLPAPYLATANGLNDAGQVVGCTGSVFGSEERRPLLGEAGRTWYLAGAGLERACALDLNDAGVVVGEAGPQRRSRAFVLSGGRLTFLDVPGDSTSQAAAVNAAGHVAVNSLRTEPVPSPNMSPTTGRASLWRDGRLVPLGVLKYAAAGPGQVADVARFVHTARDLNDRDEVVGSSWGMVCTPDGSACGSRERAFLWRDGRMIDLGKERDAHQSSAVAINNHGHVLVQLFGPAAPPQLWAGGRLNDLGAAVAGTGWKLVSVYDLNDAGQVLALARNESSGAFLPVRLDPA